MKYQIYFPNYLVNSKIYDPKYRATQEQRLAWESMKKQIFFVSRFVNARRLSLKTSSSENTLHTFGINLHIISNFCDKIFYQYIDNAHNPYAISSVYQKYNGNMMLYDVLHAFIVFKITKSPLDLGLYIERGIY